MAAPMSFYGRVIVGATTFTVILFGAIFMYYKSRKLFKKKTELSQEPRKEETNRADTASDECGLKQEISTVSTEPQVGSDPSVSCLIQLLELKINDEQLCRILTTLANKAAFTDGQNAVRCAGGLPVIIHHLKYRSDKVKTCAATCIANLSLNAHNQPVLKACIPTLLNLGTNPTYTSNLHLASLQALVNLSVSGQCGQYFSQPETLDRVFGLVGDGSSSLGQQALRVLVNLSADSTMVLLLLDYKVPNDFMNLLKSHHADESILRTLSFLINLRRGSSSVKQSLDDRFQDRSFYKLFNQRNGELSIAAETLMHHGNADVKKQAGRLTVLLSAT